MCVSESDANDRCKSSAAARVPGAFDKFALDVPSLDELLADPEVSRRVGKIIADAARRPSKLKS